MADLVGRDKKKLRYKFITSSSDVNLDHYIAKNGKPRNTGVTTVMGLKTNDQKENEAKDRNGEEENDNDGSQPEVDYLVDSNKAKNDGDNNKKEQKDGKINENENDEEKNDNEIDETNNHGETIQQSENENLLEKVVDNIMDNVVTIGFSRLNSQEDEIWNDP
uniref:Uncharacterized protein n=1 Tax=Lactuca sativa TaxID=4236 RepID=A0A9R1V2S1_LACSA|nr:hypothetical protein LSAT_V11C600327010 [Lactuca sativa]